MDLESWITDTDPLRRRRLLCGGALGLVAMAVSSALVVSSASAVLVEAEAEPTIVSLEEEVPRDEPDAPEEPEAEPADAEAVRAAGPRLAALRVPTEIPKERPREVEAAPGGGPGGVADPYAATGGRGRTGTAAAEPAVKQEPERTVAKPPPAPPKPKAVTLVEGMTPPKPLSQPMPSYPDALKAQGIEGVCVVRYKIDEGGAVVGAKLVSGPPGFWPVIAAALRQWRFTPARDASGMAVPLTRTHRFKFGLDTG